MNDNSAEAQRLVVYGAGGHGQVVAEAAAAAGWRVVGFVDDKAVPNPESAWPLLPPGSPQLDNAVFIVAVGDNLVRQQLADHLRQAHRPQCTVTHPTAYLSPSAHLGIGSFVGPKAVVHTQARIAAGSIINTSATVEHHCTVGEFAHIAPGATLAGNVTVGSMTLVGLNATILPGVRIGSRCTVGAGAVVTRDLPDGTTAIGNPAHEI